MEGFLVHRYDDRWDEGVMQMAKWIKEGKLDVKETFVDGLESTPQAFLNLFTGVNRGKMIIKI